MESLQKFECWEELSDQESASISGGTVGFDVIGTSALGQTTVSLDQGGLGVKTGPTGGTAKATLGPGGLSAEGAGIDNSFIIKAG